MKMKNPQPKAPNHGGLTTPKSTTLSKFPRRLCINLHMEDADSWDRASRSSDLLILDYGKDILRRFASLPVASQPDIYEMPSIPGCEWQGNVRCLKLEESTARAIVGISAALSVSPYDWAYSAILAETIGFRTSEVTATKKAGSPRDRAEKIGKQVHTPADDILNMVTEAGLDALSASLESCGKIVLPLKFIVDMRSTVVLSDIDGEWKKAAAKSGKHINEWLGELAEEAAFAINYPTRNGETGGEA